jgi:hypothetical protein
MMRTLWCSTMVVGLMAGMARAQETAIPVTPDYYAGQGTTAEAYCPPGEAAHGHALHHGKHGHHGYQGPNHYGWAYTSGYPNGLWNYGHPPGYRDFKGPGHGCRTCANGQCLYRYYGCPDLFYNYYAWPSCSGIGAELYVSPLPVPPHVGHTFITYQPLMPHEFMYTHHRTYHRYYNGGQGLNRTCVHYRHSPFPW